MSKVAKEKMRSHWIWSGIYPCLLSTVYCLHPTFVSAQITFERTYGGSGFDHDYGYSVQQTSDGGYINVGYSDMSLGAGDFDVYLIKTDSLGDTLWTRLFGDFSRDQGYSVQQTSDGGYILSGRTYSFGVGGDLYLVKTDSLGNTLWTKNYGGNQDDQGWSVQQTLDGGYIIAGVKGYSVGADSADVYLLKTTSTGDTLWTKTFGGTDHDWGNSVQQTTDGGYIITGWTSSFGFGVRDVYLIKTNPIGDTLWTKTFGGTDSDEGYSVQQTTDEGYIITGRTLSFGAGNWDVYLIKTDSSGDTLWTRTYGSAFEDWGWSVQQTSDGGYIITGKSDTSGIGWDEIYLIKTDFLGNTLWTRTFTDIDTMYGIDWNIGHSVQQTSDGGYIIAGSRGGLGVDSDFYLIKTDMFGMVGIEEEPDFGNRNLRLLLEQNKPNPFHNSTEFSYLVLFSSYGPNPIHTVPVSLKVYDITGKLMEILVENEQQPGYYTIFWNGNNAPSGIYFYSLQAGKLSETRKMILLK